MKEFEFTVDIIPKGKERPRATNKGGFSHIYTPRSTMEYERKIAECFLESGGTVFEHKYIKISVKAYFPIPKNTRKSERLLLETDLVPYDKKPDVDNVVKSVMDALNNVAYIDDKQVVSLKAEKFYSKYPRLVIVIQEVEPDVS